MTYSNPGTLHQTQVGISEVLVENPHRPVAREYTNLEVEVLVLPVWALAAMQAVDVELVLKLELEQVRNVYLA